MATDIATKIVTQKLQEAQYTVARIPDHHHNGTDSSVLEPTSNSAFSPLPSTFTGQASTAGVVNSSLLGNQVVGQGSQTVGYGNSVTGTNQNSKGIFYTSPIPVIYGSGVGTDSQFNGGDAPQGTMIFFSNGTTISGLWVKLNDGTWAGSQSFDRVA